MFRVWGGWLNAFHQSYNYIFLLSSARAGSTLLTHVLTSNPEIFGMGESKIALADQRAFPTLTGKNSYFHWRNDLPRSGNERYILDKLVHNRLLEPENVGLLNDSTVRVIFLLREPQATLVSYMKALKVNEASALAYFVSRMDYLAQYAEELNPDQQSLFLTYEALTKRTQPALELLEDFLDLQQPLSEQYEVTKTTGKFGVGDNSENIKSGRIVKVRKRRTESLTPRTITTAEAAYHKCVATFHQNCTHIAGDLHQRSSQPQTA
jgi:hypothetical protein